MPLRIRFLTAVLIALFFSTACRDDTISPVSPESSLPQRAIGTVESILPEPPEEPRVYGALDRHYVELARDNPAFAGLFFDSAGSMVVRSKTGRIPEGITRIGRPDVPKRAAPADFSFLELAQWYGPFVDAVATTTWYSTDINERRNRLTAGVEDVGSTREALEQAGVPSQIYVLEKAEPGQPVKKITDEFRPVPGGVQTDHFGSDEGFGCTAGFNLSHWDFGRTFVTASHCTVSFAALDGLDFYQPTHLGGASRIGEEVYDEPGFSSSECPNTYCRYSDAALVGYDAGVDYELELIARTYEQQKSKTIDPNNPRYQIVGEAVNGIADGTEIIQIGRTDGWSIGVVNETCVNRPSLVRNDLTLLCQYGSSEGAQDGDSGGPVFIPVGGDDDWVSLAGIIIQRQDEAYDTDSFFSPINGIRQEVKPNSGLECNGLSVRTNGDCGPYEGTGGSGEGGDGCGPFAVTECQ